MTQVSAVTFDDQDEYNRKPIADKIISLLEADIDISPLVLDGTFGTGKTEFCHKLVNLMRSQNNQHVIYIDAFEADHADQPLFTVLAEVIKLFGDNEEAQLDFTNKSLAALRFGAKLGLKAFSSHILRQDGDEVADDFDKALQKEVNSAIDASVKELMQDHVKAEESMASLKAGLKEIADEKPIVIFIDELDRCRPDYAIHMLETIKHTFNVEGVQVVLVTKTEQLRASINHSYGHNIDAHRYLDKFIKFNVRLNDNFKVQMDWVTASVEHYKNLIKASDPLKHLSTNHEGVNSVIYNIINANQLSLREVEAIVRHMEIYQALTENGGLRGELVFGFKLTRVFAVALYCLEPNLVKDIQNNTADAKTLGDFIGIDNLSDFDGGHPYPSHSEVLISLVGPECKNNQGLFRPRMGATRAAWESLARQLFEHSHLPTEGNRKRLLNEVFNTLMMCN